MRHLEDGGAQRRARAHQRPLAGALDVGGQQHGHAPHLQTKHASGIVAPRVGGRERREHRAAERQRAALRRAVPGLAHAEELAHGGHAARVVHVRMRDDDGSEPQHAAIPEKRRHHALTGVEPVGPAGAGIHQHRTAVGPLDDDRLALAHVEHAHAQPAVGRPQRRPEREQCAGEAKGPGREPEPPRGAQMREAQMPRPEAAGERRGIASDGERARRGKVGDGAGHGRGERDAPAQEQQHRPEGGEEPAGHEGAEHGERDCDQPQHRGETGQRDDGQVGDDADRGDLVEVCQPDRQHGELRRHAHPERRQHRLARQRSQHDSRGGGERELEARVAQIVRPECQDHQRGQREAVEDGGLPLEEQRAEDQDGHDRGPQHRGLAAHDGGEAEHDGDGDQ